MKRLLEEGPTNAIPAAESPERTPSAAPYAPVTARAVLLGMVGAVGVSALQVADTVIHETVILPVGTVFSLFAGPVFWLFLLAVLNAFLRRRIPNWSLHPAEFTVIYALTTVAAAISEHDEVQFLWPMFVYPFRAAQRAQAGYFRTYIPRWLVPQDSSVIEPYYLGHSTFWQPRMLLAWLIPLIAWMAFLAALGVTMWAWNVILRRRWVEHDRLSFPCVQLPLQMCCEAGFGGMVSGKLFWCGLLVSALIESLAQLHGRFPTVPGMPLDFQATPFLDSLPAPWNALSPMYLTWGTFFLGVCYMIPADILFSAWFFFLLRKAMEVFGFAHGWREAGGGWDIAGFPNPRPQAAGAWIALFFLLVWAERHHLRRVIAASFTRREPADDAREPGSYRWAGRLLVFGTLFQVAWLTAAGMSLALSLAYTAFFWILFVTMTRVYAQVGPPMLELYFLNPQRMLPAVFGTLSESPRSLSIFSLMYWINRGYRGQPMAHQLAAFTIGGATRTNPRILGKWILVAFGAGALTCLVAYLHWAYRSGEDQFFSGGWQEVGSATAIARLDQWVHTSGEPDWNALVYMVFGGGLVLALAKASYTFIGFPFHPVGYALAVSFAVEYDWPAFALMWAVKSLLLRYGGRRLYQRYMPFFLGLTLGGLIAPVCWGFLSWLFAWYKD